MVTFPELVPIHQENCLSTQTLNNICQNLCVKAYSINDQVSPLKHNVKLSAQHKVVSTLT